MVPVVIASTIDRSVLGIMVDFAKAIPFALERVTWDEGALALAEARLAETPCHATRRFEDVVFPDRRAPELLLSRWGAA